MFIQDERITEAKHTLNRAVIVSRHGGRVEIWAVWRLPLPQALRSAAFAAVVQGVP